MEAANNEAEMLEGPSKEEVFEATEEIFEEKGRSFKDKLKNILGTGLTAAGAFLVLAATGDTLFGEGALGLDHFSEFYPDMLAQAVDYFKDIPTVSKILVGGVSIPAAVSALTARPGSSENVEDELENEE